MTSPRVGALQVLFTLSALLLGCGKSASRAEAELEPPDATGCAPWLPSETDWSSLPTSRPANLGSLSLSADGKYLYGLGTWLEAGVTVSGVFRSSSWAETWCLMPLPSMQVSSVAASPAHQDYLYVSQADSAELLKTTDGGITWQSVSALPEGTDAPVGLSAVDPERLHVSGGMVSWLSSDGGESWSELTPPAELDSALYTTPVVFDPTSPERMAVVGITEILRVFVTTDSGSSWQESFPPLKADFSIVPGPNGSLLASSMNELVLSSDWGQSWNDVHPLPAEDARFFAAVSLDEDALYFSGTSGLWRSGDGGLSFESVPLPEEVFEPVLTPSAATIVGKVAGAFAVSTDAGQSWKQHALVPTPLTVAQSPVDGWPLWSGAPHAYSADGGITWRTFGASTDRAPVPDGEQADAAFMVVPPRELKRTEDGGKTWSTVSVPLDVEEIHGVASCPAPHDCLYLLYGRLGRPNMGSALASDLVRSPDRGKTWESGLPVPVGALYYPEAMAVAPDDPDQLLMSGDPGLVETRDGGLSWQQLTLPGVSAVGSIALFPDGVRLVGSRNLGLPVDVTLRSSDDGESWSELEGRAGIVIANHVLPDTVVVLGAAISVSHDRGETWSRTLPPPNLPGVISNVASAPDGSLIACIGEYGFVRVE